jgi:hypothetical protein
VRDQSDDVAKMAKVAKVALVKQQVNLYLPEFQPQQDWLDARHVLRSLLLVLLLLILYSVFNHWRLSQVEAERGQAQQALDELAQHAEALERALAASDVSAAVQRELEQAESGLARSRDTLSFVRSLSLGNMEGFSEPLKDLARASFDGLWLTEVAIGDGGEQLRLRGQVLDSVMLPAYISRLAQGKSELRDRSFQRLSAARNSGSEAYEFVLETR